MRGRWQKVQVDRQSAEAMPVAVSLLEGSLLAEQLPGGHSELPALHSSWLLPTVKTSFEYAAEGERAALPDAPARL